MRIVSWNCNMAFRKKADYILNTSPDILIVQECESPSKHQLLSNCPNLASKLWVGDNQSKGLGVFSFSHYELKVHEMYNPGFRYVLPLTVSGPTNFNLFAIWAMDDPNNSFHRYIAQVWLALNYYDELLCEPTILAGDFNSNAIWDDEKPKRAGTHSDVVNYLREKGIHSAYHRYYGEVHGQETKPTLYMYRKQDKPYHIDYCFASQDLLSRLVMVDIGSYEDWSTLSDHSPILCDFLGK